MNGMIKAFFVASSVWMPSRSCTILSASCLSESLKSIAFFLLIIQFHFFFFCKYTTNFLLCYLFK